MAAIIDISAETGPRASKEPSGFLTQHSGAAAAQPSGHQITTIQGSPYQSSSYQAEPRSVGIPARGAPFTITRPTTSDAVQRTGAQTSETPHTVAVSQRAIRPRPSLPISDVELRARIAWNHHTTSHFSIAYDRTKFQEHELRTAASMFEEGYSSIFALTHESYSDRIHIYLIDRHAAGLLGRSIQSHFNCDDRAIYLVRSSSQTAYAELLYLLAHAMRLNRFRKHYGSTPGWTMLEDSFSIFLQLRLTVSDDVFPFYGVEPDIVAFHVLRDKQRDLISNKWEATEPALDLERYVIAGAFLLFLGDTFGDDKIVQLSKCEEPITSRTFKSFFGQELAELESHWLEHLPTALMTLTHEEHTYAIARWEQCFEARN